MKNNSFVSIEDIRKKVDEYVDKMYGEKKCLFDPIIREEDGKYYFGYMIVDFIDESKEDYRIKRPTKWLLIDMFSGELYKSYNVNEKDYTSKETIPLDRVFDNNSSSELFDISNLILDSFSQWKSKVTKELEIKSNEKEDEKEVLKSGEEFISPIRFVISNIDPLLDEIGEELTFKLGDKISELNKEYYLYLLDSIRKEYLESDIINKNLVVNYIELLKYLWPDFKEIIEAFNNIN